MGALTLPASGTIYADAQIAIYSVDGHPVYAPLCESLWDAADAGTITVVSSELTLMETLVGPLRNKDASLAARRENLWRRDNVSLSPISLDILREAARLRAAVPALRTPDAIHAATALVLGCALFVTNDTGFRRIPALPIVLLDNLLNAPN